MLKPDTHTDSQVRQAEIDQVRTWRRDLHQIPELGLDLPETQAYLLDALSGLDCSISFPISSAVAAFFDAGKSHTIAFRSDMDALPVYEQTGAAYKSRKEGCMHACGHDGHMSNLLLFAHRLNRFYQDLDCNILLIFQPGEENPGGSRPIVETGLLRDKNVAAIFGLHLWPLLPKGVIASRPGPLMARSSEINVTIHGKASHAARYTEGIDALETGMHFIQDAYALERSFDPSVFRLLRFGRMEAGRIRNVVADTCRIEGTLRAFEPEHFQALLDGIEEIRQNLEQQTGAKIEITYSSGYPAVINDASLFKKAKARYASIETLERPEMISEDFSGYLQEVPGVFFFLGTGTGIELHDSRFDFEEDLLLEGADLFEALARLDL